MRFLTLAVGTALLLGGCGGGSPGNAPAGANIAPENALAFVSVDTNTDGSQWTTTRDLLAKFPVHDRLSAAIERSLSEQGVDFERDVKPAFGNEVDLVVLAPASAGASPTVVALTQPDDESKLEALLDKANTPYVKENVEGWTAIAQTQADLDRFDEARKNGTLDESDRFKSASSALESDALVSFYVDGKQLGGAVRNALQGQSVPFAFNPTNAEWLSGALRARDDGFLLRASAKGAESQSATFKSELVDEVPARTVAFVSFSNLEQGLRRLRNSLAQSMPFIDPQIGQVESALGVSLERDILPLFANEGAIALAPGEPFPAVSLILKVDDETKARGTLDRLARGIARLAGLEPPVSTEIAGTSAGQLVVRNFSVFYAVFDGKAVITTARDGIAGLRESGGKLGDDATFKAAKDASGMPDDTAGFVYVDIQKAANLAYDLAQAGGKRVPADARANIDPLESLIAYSARDGDRTDVTALVRIK